MPLPSPSLVVFDLAGTTIEDHDVVARCLAAAVRSEGVEVNREEANSVMGLPKPVAITRLLARHEGKDEAAIDVDRVCSATAFFEDAILRHYRSPGAVVPIEGIEGVFTQLRDAGVKIAIDTGFSSVVADAILDQLGWIADGVVTTRVTSDEVPHGRPSPDLLFEAMLRCGVYEVRSVAKVGDTPADLGEGQAAGCGWVVGVTYGTHTRAQLVDHPHTALVDDVEELLRLFAIDSPPRTRPTRGRRPGLRA